MEYLLFVGEKNTIAELEIATQIPSAQKIYPNVFCFEHEGNPPVDIVSNLGSGIKLAQLVPSLTPTPKSFSSTIQQKNFSLTILGSSDFQNKTLPDDIKQILGSGYRYILPKFAFGISPLVYSKQSVQEFFISPEGKVYKTIWVHSYKEWIQKDRKLPGIDPHSGMLPPKIARSLINLVKVEDPASATLVDPFCGSGRIVIEAAQMGFQVIASDISPEKISQTQQNLNSLDLTANVFLSDAVHLSTKITTPVDLIVTEPFMGRPNLVDSQIRNAAKGLTKLYTGALKDWHKILKKGGYVVMIFPSFSLNNQSISTSVVIDDPALVRYNVKTRNLFYSRPQARLKREIVILQSL